MLLQAIARTLPFPFPEIAVPDFAMTAEWRFDYLVGYLSTWSAVTKYRAGTGGDPVRLIEEEMRAAWGDTKRMRRVSWPLSVRAGHV